MNQKDSEELKMITDAIVQTVDVEEIFLFGSFAYGIPNADSDFDIYVVLPDDGERPLKAVQKINLAIARMDIRAVDLIAGTVGQFYEKCKVPTLERTIMKKGVKLHDRQEQLYQTMA